MSATSRDILVCKQHSNPQNIGPKGLLDLNNDNTIELSIVQVGSWCATKEDSCDTCSSRGEYSHFSIEILALLAEFRPKFDIASTHGMLAQGREAKPQLGMCY